MTRSQAIERIFHGEFPEYVPFVLKGWRIPFCRAERQLRNDGMGVIDSAGVYGVRSPNVRSESHGYTQGGIAYTRTVVKTPVGELSSVTRRLGSEKTESTTWTVEPMFKRPEDYKVLRFIVQDQEPVPAYEGFFKAQKQMDGEAFFKTGAPGIALHTIMYSYLGIETFALEWADGRRSIGSVWYDRFDLRGAEALATYADGPLAGLSAVTRHAVGRGSIVLLGTLPRADELRELVRNVGLGADVVPVAEASANLLVVPRNGDAGEGIVAVELENRPASLSLERPATDLLTGEARSERMDMPPYGVAVLRY